MNSGQAKERSLNRGKITGKNSDTGPTSSPLILQLFSLRPDPCDKDCCNQRYYRDEKQCVAEVLGEGVIGP